MTGDDDLLPSPAEFQRRAAALARDLPHPRIEVGGIDVVDALHAELTIRGGNTLRAVAQLRRVADGRRAARVRADEIGDGGDLAARALRRAEGIDVKLTPPLEVTAHTARRYAHLIKTEVRGPAGAPAASGPPPPDAVVALARLASHLTILVPVLDVLRDEHGIATCVAAHDAAIARTAATHGHLAVALQAGHRRTAIGRWVTACRALAPRGRAADANALAMLHVRRRVVALNLPSLSRTITGFRALVGASRPRAVLVANPYSPEGRIATLVAGDLGVPSIAVEHGSIFPDDPRWEGCQADVYCVWGEPSKRALQTRVAAERIEITGSPTIDAARACFRRTMPATLLVATSGPGDNVTLDQHRAFIRALGEAATVVPDATWTIKLHPKDDAAHYADLLAGSSGARFRIEPAGGDIVEALSGAAALVTVSSSAALDALAVGVPVIVVALPTFRAATEPVEFLQRAATWISDDAPSLAAAARAALAGEVDEATRARTAGYAAEHFAGDGHAASTIARICAELRTRTR